MSGLRPPYRAGYCLQAANPVDIGPKVVGGTFTAFRTLDPGHLTVTLLFWPQCQSPARECAMSVRALSVVIILVLSAGLVDAYAADNTLRWDLPNEYPANSIPGLNIERFASTLKALSAGRILITVHHGSSLGFKSDDHFDAVTSGAVQLASSSTARWGGINSIFQLSSLPFLTSSPQQVRLLYEVARRDYERVLEDSNQVLLFAAPWPPSGVWATRPIISIENLRELRIRTYDTFGTNVFRQAHASPLQLSWVDIIPQLATGGIDAVLTSAEGGASAGFEQYMGFFTELNYASPLQIVHMNRDIYRSLSELHRQWVDQAAADSETFGFALLSKRVEENYEQMRGQNVEILLGDDVKLLEDLRITAEAVVSNWKSRVGAQGVAILDSYSSHVED